MNTLKGLTDKEKDACIDQANELITELVAFLVDVTNDNITDASGHAGEITAKAAVLRDTFLTGALRAARL